jgi:hypothetical protein
MEDGNLLDFGQTGVIAVNHVMEDLDRKHEKGAVPTQVQSMAEKTVLEPIHKQLLKYATHLHVLVCNKCNTTCLCRHCINHFVYRGLSQSNIIYYTQILFQDNILGIFPTHISFA